MQKFGHVMIDLETLGTAADSVILSIGAVRFDLDSDNIDDAGFYRSISIDSNLDYKRRIQEDTLIWWLKQSPEAQKVFTEPKETLLTALTEFSDWLDDGSAMMWSNGADFDLPTVAHAYHQVVMDVPWKFWNSRCYRTFKGLPGMKNVNVPRMGTHHNALQDAVFQAQHLQAMHKALFGKKAVKA
jgi:exodeoxyribonuclease VIII